MKKFFLLILVGGILVSSYCIVKLKMEGVSKEKNQYRTEFISSGLEGAEDFVFDELNNIYVSLENKVIKINNDNTKEILFEEKKIKIKDIAYLENEIFYLYDDKLNAYCLKTGRHKLVVDEIPTQGDYSDNKILVKDGELYITVGSATNSGVVGKDNKWRASNAYDLPAKEIFLSNSKFDGTSPYSSYKTINEEEKTRRENKIGNASIIKVNPKTKESILIADGVRNVEGIDFDSENNIYMTVGGIEYRGARPLYGDADYIYELKENSFYGWPDYSGGDPVDSVRFRKEGKAKQSFILKKHKHKPEAPIYQHNEVSSLGSMAIDRHGDIENKDSFFIYDKLSDSIFNIQKTGAKKKVLELKNSDIEKILINDESLYLLDKKNGYILKVFEDTNSIEIANNIKILILAVIVMSILGITLILFIKRKCK